MRKMVLILVVLMVSLTSCKKDEMTTTAEGAVYEVNSSTPVPDAKVSIARVKRYTYATTYTVLDTTTADSQGRYSINSTSSNIDLIVYAQKDGYWWTRIRENENNVTPGENNKLNIEMTPHSWVRINYDQLDKTHGVYINRIEGTVRIDGFSLISDTSVISRTYGNKEVKLSTFYNISGQQVKQEIIAVTTGSHDTTDVDISF